MRKKQREEDDDGEDDSDDSESAEYERKPRRFVDPNENIEERLPVISRDGLVKKSARLLTFISPHSRSLGASREAPARDCR